MLDFNQLSDTLLKMLAIPSPCGFTDEIVRYIADRLKSAGIPFEITRRGTVRALLKGRVENPARAIISHVDTIGAMVSRIKPDGRLEVSPIGHWSSRFAEGSRVSIFTELNSFSGTLLPCVEWGVSRDATVNEVPCDWDNIELRIDENVFSDSDVKKLGIEVGNYIALDPQPDILHNGYIISRNLDNKAGSSVLLETIIALVNEGMTPTHDTYVIFTITETMGSGIGGAVLPEVSELVTVDFVSLNSYEKSNNRHITIACGDASGPYDYHLTAHLEKLATEKKISYKKKYLKAFHSDTAAALVAGHDVRTAVVAYGGDATHSIERTHFDSLQNIALLLKGYILSKPTFEKDDAVTTVETFSRQITEQNMPRKRFPVPEMDEVIVKSTVVSPRESDT